jgi:hypothetical protein
MRWLAIGVAALALAGCSSPHDTTTEAAAPDADAPRAYRELMAPLPPFDEPASAEVTAYRIASLGAEGRRCAPGTDSAVRAAFLRANAEVLALAGRVRGSRLVAERVVSHRDGNGCPAGTGPPTSFTTERTYRVPEGTTAADAFARYERVLHYGWLETSGTTSCERQFAQGAAYLAVNPCNGTLRLAALGRAPLVASRAVGLPPRPFGLQYPAAVGQPARPIPTPDEVASGETCERRAGVDVPSLIIPPTPGVRAGLHDDGIVVDWSFERVQGDCPPRRILLWVSSSKPGTPYAARIAVHDRAGTAEIRLPETRGTASVLRAATESVDGTRSRTVAVLIRRQR